MSKEKTWLERKDISMNFEKNRGRWQREKGLLAMALTAAVFLAAALSQGVMPEGQRFWMKESLREESGAYPLAWWGSLYPRICLESAMELVEDPSVSTPEPEGEEQPPVRIKWKCMDLF